MPLAIDDEVAGMRVGQRHGERLRALGEGERHAAHQAAAPRRSRRARRSRARPCRGSAWRSARSLRASRERDSPGAGSASPRTAAAAHGCAPACRPSGASSSGRCGARPSMKSTISAPPGRPARGSITSCRRGVRPAGARWRNASACAVQSRCRRRVAFVRVGDARQQAVGQTHMAVRRAGRGQRLQVGGGERRERRPLAQRGKQSISHGWGRATPGGPRLVSRVLSIAQEDRATGVARAQQTQPLRGILPSFRRGISSAKLQGRKRMSSCWRKMSSQPSLQAPVEPGRAKM